MQIRRLVPTLTVIVFVLTACSSDSSSSTAAGSPSSSASTTSANDFMTGFCTALTDWSTAIQAKQGSLNLDTNDVRALKQTWLDFLDSVNAETDTMLAKLRDLGTPDVPNGEETVSTVIDALTTLGASFKELRDRSADLPTNSQAAFTQQLQTVLTKFQTDISSFGNSFEQLQSGELETAFSAAPACAPLQ